MISLLFETRIFYFCYLEDTRGIHIKLCCYIKLFNLLSTLKYNISAYIEEEYIYGFNSAFSLFFQILAVWQLFWCFLQSCLLWLPVWQPNKTYAHNTFAVALILVYIIMPLFQVTCFNNAFGHVTAILVLSSELPFVASCVTAKQTYTHNTFAVALILVYIMPLFQVTSYNRYFNT